MNYASNAAKVVPSDQIVDEEAAETVQYNKRSDRGRLSLVSQNSTGAAKKRRR